MNNYVLLAACFLLGIIINRLGRLPDNAAASLNGFVVHIALPALTLNYIHSLRIDTGLILPALMAWLLFGAGCAFFWIASRLLKIKSRTTGALMLTCGLGNTSFIGLPMIETFYGAEFLGLGILIDQVGSYFVLSTLGILVASIYSSGQAKFQLMPTLKKIALFTPFQAFVLALLLKPVEYPLWFQELLSSLGATVVPLALFSVGYQIRLSHIRGKSLELATGILYKLIIGPALLLALFLLIYSGEKEVFRVTIFEAAMPPMIGASIVALQHDLDPPIISLIIGIGIPMAFITLPAWYYILNLL